MQAKSEPYTCKPGFPQPGVQCTHITTAVRICRLYLGQVPSYRALMRDFGMSKATAHRWIKALRDEQEEACRT